MTTAASVKAQLKYRALKEKRNVQDVLIIYVLERVLYRLSLSGYTENFVLKGGILLYVMFHEQYPRATTDIDLLGINISNETEKIKEIFTDILKTACDDPIRFDMNTLLVRNITEFKKYHGVNVSVLAYLDRTRVPVNIDAGFGDTIFPGKQKMSCPVTLDDDAPVLYAYSRESVIAEKFEAVVSLGTLNSRYKDFYDICMLALNFDFDGNTLQGAICETFAYRGTSLYEIAAFRDDFAQDPYRSGRWHGFIRRKHVSYDLSLQETLQLIRVFLEPLVQAIREEKKIEKVWSHKEQSWIDD